MCLAVPGQVEKIYQNNELKMAQVNFGGIKRATCLEYVPFAQVGDYVLVHVGFALSVIDQEEAQRSYLMLAEQGELAEFEQVSTIED